MSGKLIYLMGPSGSGKDSLLRTIRHNPALDCRIARRLVTRPPELRAEDEQRVTLSRFEAMERTDAFAMSWRANGLAYGIPRHINRWMAQGHDVLVNGSRGYLPEARQRYPDLLAILLTVREEELRKRLKERGRDSEKDIAARLARNSEFADEMKGTLLRLDNSGSLDQAARSLLAFLGKEHQCA